MTNGILVPQFEHVTIRQEGTSVLLMVAGKGVLTMPWEQALEIAKALTIQAHKAEETAKAEHIIHQEAALMRAGAPFGLVTRWDMKMEAGKEAAWGWVRKYLPNRIRQTGHVFAPTVRLLPPKE